METMNQVTTNQTENPLSVMPNVPSSSDTRPVSKVEEHAGVMAKWDAAATVVKTSLDAKKPRDRALITQCLDQAEKNILAAAGETHEIVDYFAHVVELPNLDDGEFTAKIRLVMVRADGVKISTVSEPFIKTFAAIVSMLGATPWNPPPLIRVNLRKGKSGFDYATCVEMMRPEDTPVPPLKGQKPK